MRKKGTFLVHCTSSNRDLSKLIPLIVSVLCSGQNIRKFSETTGSTEAKFHAPRGGGIQMTGA